MKKLRSAALLLTLACVLSGCQDKEQPKEVSQTKQTASPKSTSGPVEDEYYPYIDMQWVLSSICVNDVPISFPAQAADFGAAMVYGELDVRLENGRQFYRSRLTDGQAELDVEMYAQDENRDDMRIYGLSAKNTCGIALRVAGLTFGESYEQIVSLCGEPSQQREEGEARYIYYENSVYEMLAFKLENNQITEIILNYLPEEFR